MPALFCVKSWLLVFPSCHSFIHLVCESAMIEFPQTIQQIRVLIMSNDSKVDKFHVVKSPPPLAIKGHVPKAPAPAPTNGSQGGATSKG